MPHVDAFTLRPYFARNGQSRFARPVAAITAFVKRVIAAPSPAPAAPRIRQDMEVRAIEDAMRHAVDHADLERMERAYDRRDAGGWNWR
ncbi:MAG: hypothetical protein U1F54_05090 [Burkholderiales bacterium]